MPFNQWSDTAVLRIRNRNVKKKKKKGTQMKIWVSSNFLFLLLHRPE